MTAHNIPLRACVRGCTGLPSPPGLTCWKTPTTFPLSSHVPWRAHGPGPPAVSPQTQTPFTNRYSGISSSDRLTENVTASEIQWAKRPRNVILSLILGSAPGHQERCKWWSGQVHMPPRYAASGKQCIWAQPPGLGLPRKLSRAQRRQ